MKHPHQVPRRVPVAGDDDVLREVRVGLGESSSSWAAAASEASRRRSKRDVARAPSEASCGVATISITEAAMNACDPVSPSPAGDRPTSCPARFSTNENSPICASSRPLPMATGPA